MDRRFSLYLDVLRILGAVMVLFAHWSFPRFTGADHSWMRQHDLGGDGVVIFFVLSGLLIAFTADKRRGEGPALFAADRLSRLWSVALPVLVFGLILDLIGQARAPELYAHALYHGEVSALEMVTGATFTNQLWFLDISPGGNSPYWSLGYEAWYYAIFASFIFAPARYRWGLAALLVLIAGPKILLLAPSWLLGVWLWSFIKQGGHNSLTPAIALALTIAPIVIYVIAHMGLWHQHLIALTYDHLGEDLFRKLSSSDSFIWAACLGLLVTAHLIGVFALLNQRSAKPAQAGAFDKTIRWLAGGSFALYLVHFPVLNLLAAYLPGDALDLWRQITLLAGAVVVSYVFAELTERRRPALRQWMRGFTNRKPAQAVSNAPNLS